ncbi:MAG: hypothetical protein AAB911_00960 [Patescibacteria group bacterium]
MDLRTSILKSKKPRHQFHDATSLGWLSSHRPKSLPRNYKTDPKFIRVVEKFQPWKQCKDSWFSNHLIKDGIHGFRHVCRVSISAIFLALTRNSNISQSEMQAIMVAGLLHDCRRKNDNADPNHGVRAATWLAKRPKILVGHLLPFLPAIQFAISIHNDSYELIEAKSAYKKFKFIVDILKTADGLDRYRFPRSDWWFSPHFAVLLPDLKEMSFAFDLALASEKIFFDTKNNPESMIRAWEQIIK